MSIRALLAEAHRRDPVLSTTAWLHVALLIVILAIAPFDHRTILGLNPWIKPAKFAISIALYLWTLAWYLAYMPGARLAKAVIRWGVAISMVVEIACITLQPARGTTSHYNTATPFDFAVFATMAFMILLNTLLVTFALGLFTFRRVPLPAPYRWGIRLGLLVFILGGLEGMAMIQRNAHTVGLPDGGPGLPWLNWSTRAGDLRVAHFLGLHALQIIPLAGHALSRSRLRPARLATAVVIAFAGLYMVTIALAPPAGARGPTIHPDRRSAAVLC